MVGTVTVLEMDRESRNSGLCSHDFLTTALCILAKTNCRYALLTPAAHIEEKK